MKEFITALLLSITFSHIIAQLPATFQIRYYTTENGLPSNGIKGIQWDEESGFLWFGTEAGIVRFNGIDFKTFTNQNTPFIRSERIAFMIRNNRGVIYGVDVKSNIVRVHQSNLVFYRRTPSFNGLFDPNLQGLFVSDSFLNYKIAHPGRISFPAFFTRMLSLTDTSMVIINQGKVFFISLKNEKYWNVSLGNSTVKTAFKMRNNLFLMADNNDLFRADVATQTLSQVPIHGDGRFSDAFRKKDAQLFWENGYKNPLVISHTTAWELLYNDTAFTAKEICNVVPENIFIRFAQYSEEKKLLFIGTVARGLIVISENRVNVVKDNSSENDNNRSYYSQVELPGNRILAGDAHVFGPTVQTERVWPIRGSVGFNTYTMSDSLLWFSQQDLLNHSRYLRSYNYKTLVTVEYPKIRLDDNFGLVYSNGKIYVATNKGLGELQQDSLYYLFRQGLTPYNMVEISRGIFVVASCTNLIRFNTLAHTVDTILSSPDNCIRALWKFKDYLFIGTYGKGYYIYKNGKLKNMPTDKNNFLSHTHCFILDKYGYCWMSTNHGLFKSRLADLVNAFENNNEKIYYHYIGRNDGMDITEMNGGCTPCALQLKNETISFPTMDGLLWVDPEKATSILPTGNIFIDEIRVDTKKIDADSLAAEHLPPRTKEIVVELGFSAWCNKENIYIDYDLNNSGKWTNVNTNNGATIRLAGLGHGNYNLRIRKLNGFGPNNCSYSELRFHINTPWTQQWWFYILIVAVAAALGSLYIRLRTRQYAIQQRKLEQQVFEKTKELQLKNEILEKNDTIKTRLISIISHDVITPLKFLTVAGKNLLQKKELMSEEMQNETISEITNTSQDLQLISTNILNWIKYQNENRRMLKETFNVHELVNQVLGVLTSLAKQKHIHIANEVELELMLYQFAEPLRILIYNLVLNAINFSEKGNIIIRSQQEKDQVIMSVKDEGIGMTAAQIQNILGDQVTISSARTDHRKGHGLGYLIIKDLLKMMGAEIAIESEREKGTTVLIKIPVK